MRLILSKTFDIEEHAESLSVYDQKLWIASREKKILHGFSGGPSAVALQGESVTKGFGDSSGGIAWDGNRLIGASAKDRRIFRFDPATGKKEDLIDLATLQGGNNTGGLRASNSEVTDIAWHSGMLWVSVEAGYSSCIIEIDINARRITKDFWSPGPKPMGLDFDKKSDRLWIIEGRKMELVDFNSKGEWLGTAAKLPVQAAHHLSIDDDNNIWTIDAEHSQVHCIRMEE
ncbi:MAG: hypothetical protein ABFD82_01155 [Syntrophaceae bacterium]